MHSALGAFAVNPRIVDDERHHGPAANVGHGQRMLQPCRLRALARLDRQMRERSQERGLALSPRVRRPRAGWCGHGAARAGLLDRFLINHTWVLLRGDEAGAVRRPRHRGLCARGRPRLGLLRQQRERSGKAALGDGGRAFRRAGRRHNDGGFLGDDGRPRHALRLLCRLPRPEQYAEEGPEGECRDEDDDGPRRQAISQGAYPGGKGGPSAAPLRARHLLAFPNMLVFSPAHTAKY